MLFAMKKAIKIFLIVLTVLFLAVQFIRPDFTNPPVIAEQRLEANAEVAALLQRSCNDCHTNETVYPWYSQVSPVSWWLKSHIDEGRAKLNFSEWGTYSASKKVRKLEEICDEIRSGQMPLPSYTWSHRDAVLSDGDVKSLCDWTDAERVTIESLQ